MWTSSTFCIANFAWHVWLRCGSWNLRTDSRDYEKRNAGHGNRLGGTGSCHGGLGNDRPATASFDSDVPRQAPNARLIALLLPFWLEGLGDRSCRGEGGT
jgi:hypothetical protein